MAKDSTTLVTRLLALALGQAVTWTRHGVTLSLIREGRWVGPVERLSVKIDAAGEASPILYALSVFPLNGHLDRMANHLDNLIQCALDGPVLVDHIQAEYVAIHDPQSVMVGCSYWIDQTRLDLPYDILVDQAQAVYWYGRPVGYNSRTQQVFGPGEVTAAMIDLELRGIVRRTLDPVEGERLRLSDAGVRWLIPRLAALIPPRT